MRSVPLTFGDDGVLMELAVAADIGLLEVPPDQGQHFVQDFGGAVSAGAVAGAIDGSQGFVGLRQGAQLGMVGPLSIVGEVGPLLAFPIDGLDGGIQVDGGHLPSRTRDLPPDLLPSAVDNGLEGGQMRFVEAAEEISGRGGIGDAAGTEQVLDGLAVLEVGDILDAPSADEEIVNVGEQVVGFVVGKMELEQRKGSVEVFVQFQTHDQIVGQGQPSVGRDLAALLQTHTDLAVGEDGPVSLALRPEHRLVLMACDFPCAGASTNAAGSSRTLHLKGLLAQRFLLSQPPQYTAARRPFPTRQPTRPRLFWV